MDVAAVFVGGGHEGRRVGIAVLGPALPTKASLSLKTARKGALLLYEFVDNEHMAFLEHALLVLRPSHVYIGHNLSAAAGETVVSK